MGEPKIGWKAFNAQRADYLRAYQKQYHLDHADKKRERARVWYSTNKDEALTRQRLYRETNPLTPEQKARRTKVAAELRASNPEETTRRKRLQHLKRRAAGVISMADVERLMASPVCAACGSTDKPEIDHILPIALGGTSDPGNLQILCAPCNRSKGAKHPSDWNGRRIRG